MGFGPWCVGQGGTLGTAIQIEIETNSKLETANLTGQRVMMPLFFQIRPLMLMLRMR
jgi:hypothetical protein